MKKMNATVKILIGLILGMIVGIVFGEKATFLQPIGNIFINLIKMLVIPLVMCSIINSVSGMKDLKVMGRVGGKTVLLYVITTMGAGALAIVVGMLFHVGEGLAIVEAAEVSAETPTVLGILLNIVPSNIFAAMANFDTLPCIVFSVLFGVAIVMCGEVGQPVRNVIGSAAEVIYKMVNIIVKIAPLGVFALIAASIGENGPEILSALGLFCVLNYVCGIILLIVFCILAKLFTKIPLGVFIKGLSKVFMTAFSTRSSAATLPVTIKTTVEDLGVDENLARFTLPIGCTINMNGNAVCMALAAVLASYVYGQPLSFGQIAIAIIIATISSIGMPGVPNSGIVFNTMMFSALGFPAGSLIAMIASVESLNDMMSTGLNVSGDVLCAAIVDNSEKKRR